MVQYEALDDGVEINGQTITATLEGVRRFSDEYKETVRASLEEEGVEEPAPGEWYPQQAWLNAFGELADELDAHLLDRIGEQIPDTADWPGGVSGVEEALRSIDVAYHENHRGGDIGHYRFERTGDRVGEVECRTPYPCPFDRGIVRATARKYSPVRRFVFVEETGEACRREGGETCTYTVHW